MKTVRTVPCKLAPTAEQRLELDATLVAFAEACNYIADVARREHTTNKVKLQHACYTDVRARFGLSANLAIRAIARVCAALKVKSKARSTFEPTSIDYDQRIFSFREWDWTFSLTLLHSRARLDTALGDYQKGRLKGHSPTSATLRRRSAMVRTFCMSKSKALLRLPERVRTSLVSIWDEPILLTPAMIRIGAVST